MSVIRAEPLRFAAGVAVKRQLPLPKFVRDNPPLGTSVVLPLATVTFTEPAGSVVCETLKLIAAVVVPPLAFLVATLTAGQLTLGATGSLLEREGFMVFKSLAVNAPWILASVVVALVIVLVRRRRLDSSQRPAAGPADPAA